MKLLMAAVTVASLSVSTAALAGTDCHQDLKDMLQGTLEIESETNNIQNDHYNASSNCTLATWQRLSVGVRMS